MAAMKGEEQIAREDGAVRAPFAAARPEPHRLIADIVASYEDLVIRLYSSLRFRILRQVFLEEIGEYLPQSGRILDLGCGFGLFSLYFASRQDGRMLVGVDRNRERIEHARTSARRLGLTNVEYVVGDAFECGGEHEFDAIYVLDLVHHLPKTVVPDFLLRLRARLRRGGILLLKEVEDRPRWKMWFTLILDRLMVGREEIHYWSPSELIPLLEELGFQVVKHRMRDFIPYPHILYVCRLPSR
jgi:2-polyprenyl-3-methyl-5-hydroxy-6-metoxy-1,4-benzoquinol methylase